MLDGLDILEDTSDDDVEEESDDDVEYNEESEELDCERFLGLPDCCELASLLLGLCSSHVDPHSSSELSKSGSLSGVLLSFLPFWNFIPCSMSVLPRLNDTAVGTCGRSCLDTVSP